MSWLQQLGDIILTYWRAEANTDTSIDLTQIEIYTSLPSVADGSRLIQLLQNSLTRHASKACMNWLSTWNVSVANHSPLERCKCVGVVGVSIVPRSVASNGILACLGWITSERKLCDHCATCGTLTVPNQPSLNNYLVLLWPKDVEVPLRRRSLTMPPAWTGGQPFIEAALWDQALLTGAVISLGRRSPGPAAALPRVNLSLGPSLDLEWRSMLTYAKLLCCSWPACTGPRGHVPDCRLSRSLKLPDCLFPTVEALGLTTDLFAGALHRCKAKGLVNWFSDVVIHVNAGSTGNALDVSWKGMRALVFPPQLRFFWSQSCRPKIAEAILDATTLLLIFGRFDVIQPGADCTLSLRELARSTACPTLGNPAFFLTGQPMTVKDHCHTWGLWIAHGGSTPPIPPRGWGALLKVVFQWTDARPSDWLSRLARAETELTATRAKLESDLAQQKRWRTIQAAVVKVERHPSMAAKKWLFLTLCRETKSRGPAADVSDILDVALKHLGNDPDQWPGPWSIPPTGLASHSPGPSLGFNPIEWTKFFSTSSLSLGDGWPGRGRTGTWLLRWPAPGDWIVRVSQTSTSAAGGGTGYLTVHLKTSCPIWVTACVVFIDVLANDRLLFLTKRISDLVVRFQTVEWTVFLDKYWEASPPPGIRQYPMRRHRDLYQTLLQRWACLPTSAPIDEEPARLPPHDGVSLLEACAPRPGLPTASNPLPRSSIIADTIKVNLRSHLEVKSYREAVSLGLSNNLDPRDAVVYAAKLCGQVVVLRPHIRRQAKRKHTDRHLNLIPDLLKFRASLEKNNVEVLFTARAKSVCAASPSCHKAVTQLILCHGSDNDWENLRLVLDLEVRLLTNSSALCRAADERKQAVDNRAQSALLYKENRSAALTSMSRPACSESTKSLAETVLEVRDRGRSTGLSLRDMARVAGFPEPRMLASPNAMTQWSPLDIIDPFDPSLPKAVPEPPLPLVPQPEELDVQAITEWRNGLTARDRLNWDASADRPLCSAKGLVQWPLTGLDFKTLGSRLSKHITVAIHQNKFTVSSSGALSVVITDPLLTTDLRPTNLLLDGSPPDLFCSTDGSGTGGLASGQKGPGGFGSLLFERNSIVAILGGSSSATSGMMELAAVLETIPRLRHRDGTPTRILMLADYMTWVNADLDALKSERMAGMQNKRIWAAIIANLDEWFQHTANKGNSLDREHTKSHCKESGHWGNNLNEIVDLIAGLGKTLAIAGTIPDWQVQPPAHQTSPEEIQRRLLAPITLSDIRTALKRRTSNARDTSATTNRMLEAGPPELHAGMRDKFNICLFRGEYPTFGPKEQVLGLQKGIGKPDGGTRNLTIPDCFSAVFSSILATRLLHAAIDSFSISKAQKCNIPGVAGTDENVFLFMGCLYEFHHAAAIGKLVPNQVRIAILNDISQAFDDVEPNISVQAVDVVLGLPDPIRLQALILSFLEKLSIVVSVGGLAVVIRKKGGFPQGNAASPVIFLLVMEFARRQLSDEDQARVKFRLSEADWEFRLDIDYADDQIRWLDEVPQARSSLALLQKVLKAIGLNINLQKIAVLAIKWSPLSGVTTFDPMLTVEQKDGSLIKVKAYNQDSWFKVLGIYTNYRGDFHMASTRAVAAGSATISRVSNSSFPIHAKLDAIKTIAARESEYLFFNGWIHTQLLEDLDLLERKSLRAFLGFNLPNSYIKGELKLSLRVKRQEILHLAGFVKRLVSNDVRVKVTALLVSRDAGTYHNRIIAGKPLTSPRFFAWTEKVVGRVPVGLLNMGPKLSWLANRWAVGIWEQDDEIKVAIAGNLTEPHRLLKVLAKQLEKDCMADLENRVMTNCKEAVPEFDVSWGLAGRKDNHRKANNTFLLSPRSCFSDGEIRILLGLRLRLWRTPYVAFVRSEGTVNPRCKCGSMGTVTHYLNVPKDALDHSSALRAIPQSRHAELTSTLVNWISKLTTGWKLVSGDLVPPDPNFNHVRDAITAARASRMLGLSGNQPQHHKPDVVIAKGPPTSRTYLILDVCFRSDDKLHAEDFVTSNWIQPRGRSNQDLFNSEWFDDNGVITQTGLNMLRPELKGKAKSVGIFKQSSYAKRYGPYRNVLASTERGCSVSIKTIAVGVAGLIPDFTRRSLEEIATKAEAESLLKEARFTSWRYAISAFKAWRAED
jgi:ribonuclease HI